MALWMCHLKGMEDVIQTMHPAQLAEIASNGQQLHVFCMYIWLTGSAAAGNHMHAGVGLHAGPRRSESCGTELRHDIFSVIQSDVADLGMKCFQIGALQVLNYQLDHKSRCVLGCQPAK